MAATLLQHSSETILQILDRCCDAFTFPMLDNGYVYLAASRLTLHRSDKDWGIVMEIFGFSSRSGIPDTHLYTFSSKLHGRKTSADFVSAEAYDRYVSKNPNNESRFIFPIEEGDWLDPEESEFIATHQRDIVVRGQKRSMPQKSDYVEAGVVFSEVPRTKTFEFCRALAHVARDGVLATHAERVVHLGPEMRQILQIEEWNHPDVVDDSKRPSNSQTFQQLAEVLVTGDVLKYMPTLPPNSHWKYWPEGGTL